MNQKDLAKMIKGNPDLEELNSDLLTDDPLHDGRPVMPQVDSRLEAEFMLIWRDCNGPALEREMRLKRDVFGNARRWRVDFVHKATRTAIEIHGATHTQGRHTRGVGFKGDREKMNTLQANGWRVYELTIEMINDAWVGHIIQDIRNRSYRLK